MFKMPGNLTEQFYHMTLQAQLCVHTNEKHGEWNTTKDKTKTVIGALTMLQEQLDCEMCIIYTH